MGYLKVFKKNKSNIDISTYYTNTDFKESALYEHYKTLEKAKIGSFQTYCENDFLKTIDLTNLSSNVGFMSPAVRYVDIANRFMIFESLPTYRKISVSSQRRAYVKPSNTNIYNIAVPWQVYLAWFDIKMNLIILKAYYSKGPIENLNHQLYSIPMYNVYANGKICLPKHSTLISKMQKDYSDLIINSIEDFWLGSFNTDLWDNLNNSSILQMRDNNKELLKSINYNNLDHTNIYSIFSALTLDEIMEFNFVPYLTLDRVAPINARNDVNNSKIIQQLSLRNC